MYRKDIELEAMPFDVAASPFWALKGRAAPKSLALIDEQGRPFTYGELDALVSQLADVYRERVGRSAGLLFMRNSLASVVSYLACLRAGSVPLLLPCDLAPGLLAGLFETYRFGWQLGPEPAERNESGLAWRDLRELNDAPGLVGHELALLLSTSGSTGSPKLVRLSLANLAANAQAIAQYLALGPGDRALTVLPPSYSYGLSVINSHLQAGATVVLRDLSVLTPAFAETVRAHGVTSLAGVPYTYQMLLRIGTLKGDLPSLNTLTQAGGRLDERFLSQLAQLARERGWRFFVMYGQTEATARISYLPPDRLESKLGSIGRAIPGGHLELDGTTGELVYRGPNVMLGYALQRDDLALGDSQGGVLRTGDLAEQDADGYFRIVGRLGRFVKLTGNRIGLDDLERQLQQHFGLPIMVSGRDEKLVIWIEGASEEGIDATRKWLSAQYGVHHSLIKLRAVDQLPLLNTGKRDYQALKSEA